MLCYLLGRPASAAAVRRMCPFPRLGCRCVCLGGVATCHLLAGMAGSCIVTQLLLSQGVSLQSAGGILLCQCLQASSGRRVTQARSAMGTSSRSCRDTALWDKGCHQLCCGKEWFESTQSLILRCRHQYGCRFIRELVDEKAAWRGTLGLACKQRGCM